MRMPAACLPRYMSSAWVESLAGACCAAGRRRARRDCAREWRRPATGCAGRIRWSCWSLPFGLNRPADVAKHALGLSTILAYIVSNRAVNLGLRRDRSLRRRSAPFVLGADAREYPPARSARRCASTAAIPIGRSRKRRRSAGRRAKGSRSISRSISRPMRFGEGMLDELVPASPAPDVLNYSWLDYGNRVGAWRILELCRSLELPLTVLVNSRIYERLPGADRGVSRQPAARSPRMGAPMRSGRGNCRKPRSAS